MAIASRRGQPPCCHHPGAGPRQAPTRPAGLGVRPDQCRGMVVIPPGLPAYIGNQPTHPNPDCQAADSHLAVDQARRMTTSGRQPRTVGP